MWSGAFIGDSSMVLELFGVGTGIMTNFGDGAGAFEVCRIARNLHGSLVIPVL